MYALSLGVQRIGETLPAPVYALLSGLNASTVGIIALAAVQLAEKAIRDKISRILVIFGACAGLCYSALWYFPVLMVAGGVATSLWDGLVYQQILRAKSAWRNRNRQPEPESDAPDSTGSQDTAASNSAQGPGMEMLRMRKPDAGTVPPQSTDTQASEGSQGPPSHDHVIRVRVGLIIFVSFFGMFRYGIGMNEIVHKLIRNPQPPSSLYLSQEPKFRYLLWPWSCSQICTLLVL